MTIRPYLTGRAVVPVFLSTVVFLCVVPNVADAAVKINEIAWMGTAVSANDEWIELYNDGASPVDLTGWVVSDGATLSVTLSGSVAPGAYYLLERSDDDTVPGVNAGIIYTGALANDGRTLSLRTASGGMEHQAVGGTNWSTVGGDNVSKYTAQRTLGGWVTAPATPGATNATESSETAEKEAGESATTTESTSSRETDLEDDEEKNVRISLKQADRTPVLAIGGDRTVHVRSEVEFIAEPGGVSEHTKPSLVYEWNFGDGAAAEGKRVRHRFMHPGTYVVTAHAHFALLDAEARVVVHVLPLDLMLVRGDGGALLLSNLTAKEMDISGFIVRDGAKKFIFPQRTFILPETPITLTPELLNRSSFSNEVFVEGAAGGIIGLGYPLEEGDEPQQSVAISDSVPVTTATSVAPTVPVSPTALRIVETNNAPMPTPKKGVEALPLGAAVGDVNANLPKVVTYGGLAVVILLGTIAMFALRRPVKRQTLTQGAPSRVRRP